MKDKLLTLGGFDRAKVWIEAALQDLQRTLAQHDVHVYRELTGTAAVTATPYTHAKWDVVDENVTEYRDGMIVCIKVPVAGNGTYGTALQINSLGYKPVVYNVNSMVSTRYSVGSVVWAVYNATQTASLYVNSASASTITGCWQVQDYDANTNTIGYQLRTNSSTRPVSSATYRYRLMFSSLDNSKWVPANNSTSTNATSARTVNQEVINPWGRIVYYSTTAAKTAGQSLSATAQWDRYIFNLGYSFNDGSELDLTFPGPVYIKCTPQAGGGAIIDSSTPYVQTLPSTADGKIYIYLGQAYSASEVELTDYHPVLYHDGSKIAMWTGAAAESDLFDCVMTHDNDEWSCDKNWLEIYNAHVNGKQIRLKYDAEIYMPIIIQGTIAYFGYTTTIQEQGALFVISNAFIFDLNGEVFSAGWSHHEYLSIPFSPSDKDKLDGIDAVSGVNDGTNWTSLTIGNTTKAIPQGGGSSLPSQTGNSGKILKTDGTDASWASLNSAIPTLTSPVSIWDLDAGLYFVPDGCEIYYRNSSSTSYFTTVTKASLLTVCVDDSGSEVVKRWYCWSYDSNNHLEQLLSGWTNGSNNYQLLVSSFWQRESSNSADYDIGVRDYNAVSNFNSLSFSQANGWGVGYMKQNCSNKPASLTLTEDTYFILTTKNSFSSHSSINYNYNAIRQDLYVPVHNKHYYRIVKYHNSTITPNTSIANADSYGWVEVLDTLPSISNNAGKVLAVNSNADGLEWVNQSGGGGGLSNYDFTHVNPTVSGSTATITFSANQRGSAMMGVSSDIGLTIACNNGSDNYIWVKNIGSAEIDVTISAVTKNSTAVSYVYVPSDGITVPAGGVCEIGVIVNSDGAFITSRNDLAL